MMSVGEDEQEYPDGEPSDDICTPNYSSEVTLDENGNPGFYKSTARAQSSHPWPLGFARSWSRNSRRRE